METRLEGMEPVERQRFAETLMPILRGKLSQEQSKIGHFSDAPEVMQFVCSHRCEELAAKGAKVVPLRKAVVPVR